jgi:hypothetical protein
MSRRNSAVGSPIPPTPRDRAILRDVLRHGQMTRAQIQRLHFRREDGALASFQAACRRLRLLTERGYLARIRLPAAEGSGPFVYQPGPDARWALGDESGDPRPPRRRRVRTAPALAHRLEIVDLYTALREGLEHDGGEIAQWLGESEARFQGTVRGRRVVVAPDAYCLWVWHREESAFFLEWDRGTESLTRLADKLERYDLYYAQELYEDHLGIEGLRPRLLFVVPDAERDRRLRTWLARRLRERTHPHLPTVLLGRREPVLDDPLGRVWWAAGTQELQRLAD